VSTWHRICASINIQLSAEELQTLEALDRKDGRAGPDPKNLDLERINVLDDLNP